MDVGKARPPGGAALFGLLSTLLGGCILLISPATGTTTCEFAGASTMCGSCVQANCQPAVNACCGDSTCTALSDLEACATQHGTTCTSLQSGAEGGDAGAALAACIGQSCRGECQPYSGRGTTSCSEPDGVQGTACDCVLPDADDPVNDFVCSTAAYPGTLCCAPDGWPGPGLQCACDVLSCDASQQGCECSLAYYLPSSQVCQTPYCCAYGDGCSCRASACYTYETVVTSCNIAVVSCPMGQHQVDSCSISSP